MNTEGKVKDNKFKKRKSEKNAAQSSIDSDSRKKKKELPSDNAPESKAAASPPACREHNVLKAVERHLSGNVLTLNTKTFARPVDFVVAAIHLLQVQKLPQIVVKGEGGQWAFGRAIGTCELVKKLIPGLHQLTSISTYHAYITNGNPPDGTFCKLCPEITITLTTKAPKSWSTSLGYQPASVTPAQASAFKQSLMKPLCSTKLEARINKYVQTIVTSMSSKFEANAALQNDDNDDNDNDNDDNNKSSSKKSSTAVEEYALAKGLKKTFKALLKIDRNRSLDDVDSTPTNSDVRDISGSGGGTTSPQEAVLVINMGENPLGAAEAICCALDRKVPFIWLRSGSGSTSESSVISEGEGGGSGSNSVIQSNSVMLLRPPFKNADWLKEFKDLYSLAQAQLSGCLEEVKSTWEVVAHALSFPSSVARVSVIQTNPTYNKGKLRGATATTAETQQQQQRGGGRGEGRGVGKKPPRPDFRKHKGNKEKGQGKPSKNKNSSSGGEKIQ